MHTCMHAADSLRPCWWSRRNALHLRNLKEMAELRHQLANTLRLQATAGPHLKEGPAALLASALGATGQGQSLNGPLEDPQPEIMRRLCQALTAGWADQV